MTEQQELRQWVVAAQASSQYSDPDWAAFQAAGPPDTPDCADMDTAWASSDPFTYEWIELEYEQPVYPTAIHIHQTYNPNQVVQVELRDLSNNYHMFYLGAPQLQACPYILTIPLDGIDFLVEGVLVSLDQTVLDVGWNEIDAVEADGTVWIGMKEGGIASFHSGSFTGYTTSDGLAHNMVKAVAIAPDGTIWAGTANGLSRFSSGSWFSYTNEDGLVHDIANAMDLDQDGNLWIATEAGISMYDGIDFTNYSPLEGEGRTNVKSVVAVANGDVWFATFYGVYRFDGQDWYYYNIEDGLSHDVYMAAGASPDGSVWLGSSGEAADRFDGTTVTSFKDEMGPTVYVRAIAAGQDGSMWFGTEGDGVYRYDGQIWQQFLTSNSGLAYNWADAVAVGPDGSLWFATRKNGLTRFGP